jgi:uncharacterized protein YdaU (DUF1376 family)
MHYFQFNIGDYIKNTIHLSLLEDLAYRRLLDYYYDSEKPIPNDIPLVSRKMRLDAEVIQTVLNEFFVLTPDGYKNHRADQEIASYHEYMAKQKANGSKGGRPKKTQTKPTANPSQTQNNPNQEPLTNNHKPNKNATSVAVVVPDWIPLETWEAFIQMRKRIGKPATDYAMKLLVAKLDRFRSNGQDIKAVLEKSITSSWQDVFEIKGNPADIVKLTVPPSKLPDPALEKIKADAKKATPIPDHVRQYMATVTRKV